MFILYEGKVERKTMINFIIMVLMYFSIFRTLTPIKGIEAWIITSIISSLYFIYKYGKIKYKRYISLYLIAFAMMFIHFLSKGINLNSNIFEGVYFNFIIKLTASLLSANLIIELLYFKNKKEDKLMRLLKLYIYTICFDFFLGILRVKFKSLDTVFNYLNHSGFSEEIMKKLMGYRLLPIGGIFFGGGILASTALIIMIYIIKKENKIFNWFIYVYILGSGILIARTTLVGFMISVVYFLLLNGKNTIKHGLKGVVLGVLGLIVSTSLMSEKMFQWAFEIFLKKGETSSTNVLKTMWDAIPIGLKTWIIGDSKWLGLNGYYMGTDVGYLRIIWYTGLIGLIVLIILFFYVYKISTLSKNLDLKKMNIFLLILLLVLNIKGYVEPFFISYCLIIYCEKNIGRNYYAKFNDS